jgi:DNA-binding transcriptional LysR family regulator
MMFVDARHPFFACRCKIKTKEKEMNLDLNLIKALHALLETASVTQMGERLHLSQPAASRIMGKLRDALGDPLLVRTSKGYVLTPLAESLRDTVNGALRAAHGIFAQQNFEPHTSTRQFRVCSTDYGEAIVLQPLFAQMHAMAPRIACHVASWKNDSLQLLERGDLDLALYADDDVPADFHRRDLFIDQYALIVRRAHPLAGRVFHTLADFVHEVQTYPQITASFPQGRGFALDDVLQRLGATQVQMAFTTPYFSNAPALVAGSDYVMLLPKRMAQVFARQWPICLIDIPSPQEQFQYCMIWHERAHRDQGLKWLREQIVRSIG